MLLRDLAANTVVVVRSGRALVELDVVQLYLPDVCAGYALVAARLLGLSLQPGLRLAPWFQMLVLYFDHRLLAVVACGSYDADGSQGLVPRGFDSAELLWPCSA